MILKDTVEKKDINDVINNIKKNVVEKIGKICAINDVLVVKSLPKTRSGKIIRALLKQIVNRDKIYIPPTIEDAKCLPDIIKIFELV